MFAYARFAGVVNVAQISTYEDADSCRGSFECILIRFEPTIVVIGYFRALTVTDRTAYPHPSRKLHNVTVKEYTPTCPLNMFIGTVTGRFNESPITVTDAFKNRSIASLIATNDAAVVSTFTRTELHARPPEPVDEDTSKVKSLHVLISAGAVIETIGTIEINGAASDTFDEAE